MYYSDEEPDEEEQEEEEEEEEPLAPSKVPMERLLELGWTISAKPTGTTSSPTIA